ncbi:hypothetical protein [Streptomyces sp. NBC_01304]|nr:hypothetical protein OG430_17675 [Streptomyces sp. NBC_01304]
MSPTETTKLRRRLIHTALFALVTGAAYAAGSALVGAGVWWLQGLF